MRSLVAPLSPAAEAQFVLRPAPHPDGSVDRFGFPLNHPYVDQCLLSRLGPSAIALLRRLPAMWRFSDPAIVCFEDLALACGIRTDRLSVTVHRLETFGFAERPERSELLVFTRCAPLTERELQKLPSWVVDTHSRLVTAHLVRHLAVGDKGAAQGSVALGFAERLANRQHARGRIAPGVRTRNTRKENQPSCPG